MRRTKQLLLAICISTQLISQGAWAQNTSDTLSLDQALNRVYRDNPSLWQLRQDQALWQARILQAQLGPNPELSLMNEDFAGSAAFTQDRFTQFTLALAQTLVMGNKIEYRTRLTQIQQQLSYWDYRLQLQTLGAEVYRNYVGLLNLEAEHRLVLELMANARAQHDLLGKTVQAGRLAPSVLLQSESTIKSFEAEALALELTSQTRRQELARLWGTGDVDFNQLSGSLPLAGWGSFDSLETNLKLHPRLARWQLESQQRQLAFDAAQAQTAPDVNLSGGLRYHPPLEWGLVFSVGIPLTIANRNQGNIEEARLRNESWAKERELEAADLRAQLRQAYDQAQGQAKLIEILNSQVELGEAQREAALKAFTGGKTSYLELLMASQTRDQLRRRLIDAQGKRLLAVAEVLALTQELLPDPDSERLEQSDALRR